MPHPSPDEEHKKRKKQIQDCERSTHQDWTSLTIPPQHAYERRLIIR